MAITLLFEMLGLYFLARAIGPEFRPEGGEYFPFLVVGVALLNFLLAGVDGFTSAVRDSQTGGTLEALMNTGTPAFVVVLLSAVSNFLSRAVTMLIYIAVGLMMIPLPNVHPNYFACFLILALSIACASSFGILAAAVQVWNQRGTAVVWLLGSMLWLLSGAMFPVGALPDSLQKAANWMPFTHSLRGLRLALLQGTGMQALWSPIFILLGFALLLYPLSIIAFSRAIRLARQRGTLNFY